MGQELSSHELFLTGIKESLKMRRVKARKKDLRDFFAFVSDICPWFPQEGTIDQKYWKRVGDCLNDYYRVFGPNKVPVSAFSYWNLINDILKIHSLDPDVKKILQTGETVLRESSRPPSVCQSVSIDMPEESKKQTDSQEASALENHPLKDPPKIYPSLLAFNNQDQLSPRDQADLEKQAARYHEEGDPWGLAAPTLRAPSQKLHKPPPYVPPRELPAFHKPVLNPNTDIVSLPQKISSLKEALHQKREQLQLVKELQALEQEIQALMPHKTPKKPQKKGPTPNKRTLMTFPVTRSQTHGPPSHEDAIEETDDEPPDSHEPPSADEVSDTEDPQDTTPSSNNPTGQKYHRLGLKHIKDLKGAVSSYGPTAPYTLAVIEGLSDRWLTPNDWYKLARATLSGGDHVLWRTEFIENCREIAQRNNENRTTRSWTRDKLLGEKPYHTNEIQATFPPGLLAQIQNAGLKAWRRLPPKGSATTSLAKIRQGPEEPYCEFISRLTDAAERLVKHLAYENANPTCQATIRPHRGGSLADYIKLCSGVGASHALGLAIGAALRDFTSDKLQDKQSRLCFSCKQPGHFSRDCPSRNKSSQPQISSQSAPSRPGPSTVCPRCRRGKHWASDCYSKTDIEGVPLTGRPGNSKRGQPLAPSMRQNLGAIRFVPQQSNPQILPAQMSAPSVGPPPEAQDWTSVPPPTQY
nr:PREDICTED: endogenous retrovirus group K member 6 Gag polyprotein-like [Rhinolophus sinicus]